MNTARLLKYVWPFFNIMHEMLKTMQNRLKKTCTRSILIEETGLLITPFQSVEFSFAITKLAIALLSNIFTLFLPIYPIKDHGQLIHQNLVIWDKIFKSGPSKICGRQPSKNLKFKFFKGSIPQILLDPLLNTWTHLII